MMIRRVGIVAKHGLVAASEHVARLGAWLSERGIDVVYERETLALAGAVGEHVRTATRDALPCEADLIVLLGGDGTLLAMAAFRNLPIASCANSSKHRCCKPNMFVRWSRTSTS